MLTLSDGRSTCSTTVTFENIRGQEQVDLESDLQFDYKQDTLYEYFN